MAREVLLLLVQPKDADRGYLINSLCPVWSSAVLQSILGAGEPCFGRDECVCVAKGFLEALEHSCSNTSSLLCSIS